MEYVVLWVYDVLYEPFNYLVLSFGHVFEDFELTLANANLYPNQGVYADCALFFSGLVFVLVSVAVIIVFFYVLKKIINIFC